jgi:hypothetical protein
VSIDCADQLGGALGKLLQTGLSVLFAGLVGAVSYTFVLHVPVLWHSKSWYIFYRVPHCQMVPGTSRRGWSRFRQGKQLTVAASDKTSTLRKIHQNIPTMSWLWLVSCCTWMVTLIQTDVALKRTEALRMRV